MRATEWNEVPRSVLDRASRLLGAFRSGDTELSLAELTRRTGMAKSTVHRMLRELAGLDLVEYTEDGIRLGMGLFELGSLVPAGRGLRETAAPFLSDLLEATHETVHLAVREGVEVVYLQKLTARGRPKVPSAVGGRMPAHCTGVGKALLAFGPEDAVRAVIAAGLRRRTPRTVVAPGLFRSGLAEIRERGYATEYEESTVGVTCVAAPVLGEDGCALAAISVTGWVNKLDPERLAPAVRTAALGLSRTFRGQE